MQFKHPEILYALLLLVIPIIIHLFQLRKFQKQAFTNVAFLKKVTLQTRKSSQLKKWLVLLTRLFLLACVILAFAQPYFSQKNAFNTKPETVIYLDNSFSMQAKGEQGSLLNRAIQELIENLDDTDQFTLITNDETFKNTNLRAVQNDLLQLPNSTNQLPYEAALLKGGKLFNKEEGKLKNFVFISDFQTKKNPFPIERDSVYNLKLVKLNPVNTSNISIDSIYISDFSSENAILKVALKNSGQAADNISISLFDADNLLAKISVDIEDEAIADFTLTNPVILKGLISIDDNSLQFDNDFYFNINNTSKINSLVISESDASFLKRIYNDREFNYSDTTLKQLNYSDIDNQNLIILNELNTIPSSLSNSLKVFTEKGGYVVVIPSNDIDIASYSTYLMNYGIGFSSIVGNEKRVTNINFSHPLFEHVFDKQVSNFQYPKVNSYYLLNSTRSNSPLSFEDGKVFLQQTDKVFVFSASLNSTNSNFKQSPLIVPTFFNIARQSLKLPQLYYTIGNNNSYDVSTNLQQDAVVTLKKGDNNLIPQQQYFNSKVTISTNETPSESGVYSIINKEDFIENVSYNYNRTESNLMYLNEAELGDFAVYDSVANVFDSIKSESKVNELWKWFIIFALAFLIIELLILKYFK